MRNHIENQILEHLQAIQEEQKSARDRHDEILR